MGHKRLNMNGDYETTTDQPGLAAHIVVWSVTLVIIGVVTMTVKFFWTLI